MCCLCVGSNPPDYTLFTGDITIDSAVGLVSQPGQYGWYCDKSSSCPNEDAYGTTAAWFDMTGDEAKASFCVLLLNLAVIMAVLCTSTTKHDALAAREDSGRRTLVTSTTVIDCHGNIVEAEDETDR